jgi:hypothetical protein
MPMHLAEGLKRDLLSTFGSGTPREAREYSFFDIAKTTSLGTILIRRKVRPRIRESAKQAGLDEAMFTANKNEDC